MGVKAPSQPLKRRGSLPAEVRDVSMPDSLPRFKHPTESKRLTLGQRIGQRPAQTANATLLAGQGAVGNSGFDGGAGAGGNIAPMEDAGGRTNTTRMKGKGGRSNFPQTAR